MMFKLVVVGGLSAAPEIELTELPFLIGRAHESSLVLSHRLVSRKHCVIELRDGQLIVRDLGSMNGTYVGNQRIQEAPLEPGALLTIGNVTFRAVYESDAGSSGGSWLQETVRNTADEDTQGPESPMVPPSPSHADNETVAPQDSSTP